MQNKIQEIRKKLRLSMNGITSASMRKKGVDYKLNFGVDIPRLRKMALEYAPNQLLAESLWQENVRELKILATLIYPPEDFALAEHWVEDINNVELAEQASMNLFCKMPDALLCADNWIRQDSVYKQFCGFSIYNRLLMQGLVLEKKEIEHFTQIAISAFQNPTLFLRTSIVNGLDRLISQSQQQKEFLYSLLHGEKELVELLYEPKP